MNQRLIYPRDSWLPIPNDVLCELTHELTVRECALKRIPLDQDVDEEIIYSSDAQIIFDAIYDIVSRVLERDAEVQS